MVKSPSFYQVWWPYALWYWRYNAFSLSRDGYEPVSVSYYSAKFGGHRHSGSGGVKGFRLSRDLERPRDKTFMYLDG